MTSARYVTIWCDETPDSPRMNCGKYVEGDTAARARKEAKSNGWTVNVEDPNDRVRRDYCYAHRPALT